MGDLSKGKSRLCFKGEKLVTIATVLFTYNRSKHTKQVLEALSKNTILPEKLYIFQDGPKKNTYKKEWDAVSNVINAVSWCDTEIIISDQNKGLASSIKSGVSKVLQTYDAVIVLEDDCVPHPQFMDYMVKALKKYEQKKEVYHIGASSEPVDVEKNGTDAYFLGRANSCGWGTWKDRWDQFNNDYTILVKIKSDLQLNEWFRLWAEDTESAILGNIDGTTDSWAAFWVLTIIMKKGYCMSPYESFITNIGYDNSGRHSGAVQPELRIRSNEKCSEIVLPDKIEFVHNYKKAFVNYYPWTNPAVRNAYYKDVVLDLLDISQKKINMADYLRERGIQKIAIWGRGRITDYLIRILKTELEIVAITETHLTGNEYNGIPLIAWEKLPYDLSMIIIIPGFNAERIKNILEKVHLADRTLSIGELTEKILQDAEKEGIRKREK